MKRPLILAAVVALAIGLLAFGVGLRDTTPSTHAQDAATATVAPAATATAAPAATATPAPAATATATPATTTTSTTTTTTTTSTCTATTLGVARTANVALAEDCDTLLALRDKLPRPTARNWLNWSPTLALTSWTGVTVRGTPKRVTALRLTGAEAPYVFREALADLARLDALVDLRLAAYETPRTPKTTETPDPATIPTCGPQANKALKKDCDTLLKIESTLAGTATLNWGDSSAAFTSTNAAGEITSSWDGITVGIVGGKVRVTGLELPNKSLTGIIPTQIADLTALTRLDLGRNNLSGAIPTQIGKLAKLTHLDLRNNRLRGAAIPTQIGDLKALTSLILDASGNQYNTFTGTIPTQLGNLSSLQILKLHDPNHGLRGGIPPQLGNLSSLTYLSIRHNSSLGGGIPPQLGNLTSLDSLALIGMGLTGTIPPQLGDLPLKSLRLKGNPQLTGALPARIDLTRLGRLDLVNTGVCVPAGMILPATVTTEDPAPPPPCPAGN